MLLIFLNLVYRVFVIVGITVSTKCCHPTEAGYWCQVKTSNNTDSTWAVQLILVGVTFLLHCLTPHEQTD